MLKCTSITTQDKVEREIILNSITDHSSFRKPSHKQLLSVIQSFSPLSFNQIGDFKKVITNFNSLSDNERFQVTFPSIALYIILQYSPKLIIRFLHSHTKCGWKPNR